MRPLLFSGLVRQWALATLVVAAGSLLCGADTVVLNNGGEIAGIVTEDGDWYVVEMDAGTARIRKDEVSSVMRGRTSLHEYRERAAALADDDAAGHYQLGLWCKSEGLKKRARVEFQKAIAADSEHAEARRELGYVRHEGAWMTEDQAMEARGYVKYEGSWITREERDLQESLKTQARLEAEKKKAEERARKAEMEAQREKVRDELLATQRDLAELRKREAACGPDYSFPGNEWPWSPGYGTGYYLPYYYNYPGGYWAHTSTLSNSVAPSPSSPIQYHYYPPNYYYYYPYYYPTYYYPPYYYSQYYSSSPYYYSAHHYPHYCWPRGGFYFRWTWD
ncbi:MAG: hypothetical protein RDV41_08095 [Planctomycetota bacterium]|nr:hypothetical protein [Planctomycetota bacterium]